MNADLSEQFPWSDDELADRLSVAVRKFWEVRDEQLAKQREAGRVDTGERGTATGGRHLDELCRILTELVRHAGFSADEIRIRSGIELAGFFRPMKKWDLVVIRGDRLCAAIEFKSMAGSYGNNLNNRAEEGLGSATDLWTAYRQGLLGTTQPFIGYFFLMREEEKSTKKGSLRRPFLKLDDAFKDTSYAERAELLCRRLVLERVYTSAAYLVAPKSTTGEYREPASDLTFARFTRALFGHLIGCV